MVSISLVTPAYNEGESIRVFLEDAVEIIKKNKLEAEIIVVNDGSTDDTKDICERLSKRHQIIKLINHEINKGYSCAVSTGIKHATKDFIILIDSDGQFDVKDIPAFLKKHNETRADVIVGHRVNRKGTFLRKLMSRGMTKTSNLLFGLKLKDTQCAFQFIKTGVLKSVDIESPSFQAPTEIKIKLAALGYDFEQIPITHHERRKGKTSVKAFKIIPSTILFLLYLKLKTLVIKLRRARDYK